MRAILTILTLFVLITSSCEKVMGRDPIKELESSKSEVEKFYNLADAAKTYFNNGDIEKARTLASELLRLSNNCKNNWNYGNAVHDGNMILGRIALHNGNKDEAIQYLLLSGDTPGSPQLDSFGPNLSLVNDLLKEGMRKPVIEYLEKTKKFWANDANTEADTRGVHTRNLAKIEKWQTLIKEGKKPDFGANMLY